MLTACWSVKGGSGTTVVAATLVLGALRAGRTVVAADFAGDLPGVLGLADPTGPGLLDWLDAGRDVPLDALARIAHDTPQGITLIPRGGATPGGHGGDADSGRGLADALRGVRTGGPVIVDCGRVDSPAAAAFVDASDRSLLVLRPCYLALRRAVQAPRPTAVVLITEPDRSLCARDVEDILGVPIAAQIAWDPAVASAVDSGLLTARLPRPLATAMRKVAA
jgi:MinD-like ATPase involved in chromosome partitioning or flagellar assembly